MWVNPLKSDRKIKSNGSNVERAQRCRSRWPYVFVQQRAISIAIGGLSLVITFSNHVAQAKPHSFWSSIAHAHQDDLTRRRTALEERIDYVATLIKFTYAIRARSAIGCYWPWMLERDPSQLNRQRHCLDTSTERQTRADLSSEYAAHVRERTVLLRHQSAWNAWSQAQNETGHESVSVASFQQHKFQQHKGVLPYPTKGRVFVETPFVSHDRHHQVALARPGIRIQARGSARAVAAGSVKLVEPISGFGTVIIVEHSDSYYSVYGMLSRAMVTVGQAVSTGDIVGEIGFDPVLRTFALHFDLRHNNESLDVNAWLKH